MSKKINSYYFTLLKALIIHKMERNFEATLSVKNRTVLAKSISMSEAYVTKFFNGGYEGTRKTPSNPKMETVSKLLRFLYEDIQCDSWEAFTKKFYHPLAIKCEKKFCDIDPKSVLKIKARKAIAEAINSVYEPDSSPIQEEFVFSTKHQLALGFVIFLIIILLIQNDNIYYNIYMMLQKLPPPN